MIENAFVFLLWLIILSGILAAAAFAADWLAEHPQAWVTRKLENIFRSFGDK